MIAQQSSDVDQDLRHIQSEKTYDTENISHQTGRHWPAVIIVALFVLLAVIYSATTPIFESPDELWHFPYVWRLAQTGQLPVQDPANPQLWRQEGSQPPLYYALAALITAPIPSNDLPDLIYLNPHADIGLVSPDGNANIIVHTDREKWPWRGAVLVIHLVRLLSVIISAGTILTIYLLAKNLWPEQQSLALLAISFVAFNPMFIFIAGSVNNDNLITLLASLTLWQLISIIVPQKPILFDPIRHRSSGLASCLYYIHSGTPSIWQFVSLGILIGLAALAKVSGLGLLGLAALSLLIWGIKRRSWYIALFGNSVIGLIVVAIAGWWYWLNFKLYGDWTGTETMVTMMGGRPVPPTVGQLIAEIPGFFRSFWGVFGYFSLLMPTLSYWGLNLSLAAGLFGFLMALLRVKTGQKISLRLRWASPIFLGWIIILVAGLIQWTLRTPATQGRLLFPALAALAILWAAGWMTLCPARWCILPVIMMFILAVWVPWGIIKPAYARPTPLLQVPRSAQPLEVTFGDIIDLLAYELADNVSPNPGESLPLILYWRAKAAPDRDYTVFIHLLDENELIIAQRDIFHGPGVYPTSQWHSGIIFRDTYVLQIPRTTPAPTRTHLSVGLYDHTTGIRLPLSKGKDQLRFGQVNIQPFPGPVPNPQALSFEDNITLVGYSLDQQHVILGDQVNLALYWQGRAKPSRDYKVFVHLVGPADNRAAQHDSAPQNGAAPTSSWDAGQIVLDEHPLKIAPDAPPGPYQLVVGLYRGDTGQRLRLLQNDYKPVQSDSITLAGIRVVPP